MHHYSSYDNEESDPSKGRARLDFGRVRKLARPERVRLLLGTLALFVGTGTSLTAPMVVGKLLDGVAQGAGSAALNWAALFLLVLFGMSGIATGFRVYLFQVAGEKIVASLRSDLYEAVIRRDIAFFDERRTGELTNRLSADATTLQRAVTVNLSMGLRNLLQTVGAIAILMWISWNLTLLMLAVVPIVAIGTGFYGRSLRKVSKRVQDALAKASEVAEETFAGIRTVRTFAGEDTEIERYDGAVDDSYQLAKHRSRLVAIFMGGVSFAGYAAIAAVLWYGGRLLSEGAMSFGELTSFILYTFTVAVSIASLSGLWSDFAKAAGASERLFELIDDAPLDTNSGLQPQSVNGDIHFHDVHFSYPMRPGVPVLQGLSLALQPGRVVALVGPSGGGKSTVAALLSRLYEPTQGKITLDERSFIDLNPHWLRLQVGVVSQEPILFATSITNNIRYAQPEATDEQVKAAARASNADQFVAEFPEGYDTLVGERGVRLSGGQKQRIAIARALLKDPAVLVLDEATSALDAESEHLVQEALEHLMEGRTTIVIAHRLSTVKKANRVIVLDAGKIAESGTHDELLAINGIYRRLVERQFAS